MPQGRLWEKYTRKRHLRVVVLRALLERKVRTHGSRSVGGDDRTCPVVNRLQFYSSPFLLRPPFLLSLHMSLSLAEACRYPLEAGLPKMAQRQVSAVTGSFSSSLAHSRCHWLILVVTGSISLLHRDAICDQASQMHIVSSHRFVRR